MGKSWKTAAVAGVVFQGATVAEAKAIGEEQIATLVDRAMCGPRVYQFHGMTAVVYPSLNGWTYGLYDANKQGRPTSTCVMGGTEREACASAVYHLAQYSWSCNVVADDDAYANAAFSVLLPDFDGNRERGEFRDWCHWQRRYWAARRAGVESVDACDIATRTRDISEAVSKAKLLAESIAA